MSTFSLYVFVSKLHLLLYLLVLGDINIYSYIYLEYIPILNIFMTVLKNLTHEDIGAAFKQKVM